MQFQSRTLPWRTLVAVALLALMLPACNTETDTDGKSAAPGASSGSTNSSSERGLKLCNMTPSRVGASVGFKSTKGPWISEGWWNISSHTCETLITGKLINRFYYLYVIDYDRPGEWSGSIYMCTDDKPYEISGVENCSKRGFKRTGFFEVDTEENTGHTVRLEDTKEAEVQSQ